MRAKFRSNTGELTITCKGSVWKLHSYALARGRGFVDLVRDKQKDDGTVSLDDEDPTVLDMFLDHLYIQDLDILSRLTPIGLKNLVQLLVGLAVMAVTHGQRRLYSLIKVQLMRIDRMIVEGMGPPGYMLPLAQDTLLATVKLHRHIAVHKELGSLQDTVFLILTRTRQLSIMSPGFVKALEAHILKHNELTKMLINYLVGGTISDTEH